MELAVAAGLAVIKWIFNMLGEKSAKKKSIAKLITRWMIVMRKDFNSSTATAEESEKLWKEEKETPWQESP